MLSRKPNAQSRTGPNLLKVGTVLVMVNVLTACGASQDNITSDDSRQTTLKAFDEGRQKLVTVATDKALWSEGIKVGAQTLDTLAKDKAFSGAMVDAKANSESLFSRAPKLVVDVVSPLEMGSYLDNRTVLDVRPDRRQAVSQPQPTQPVQPPIPVPANTEILVHHRPSPDLRLSEAENLPKDKAKTVSSSDIAGILIQLGSFSTRARAMIAWQSIRTQSPGLMTYAPHFERVMTAKGPLIRLRLAIESPARAEALCHSLKLSDTWCTHPKA